MTSGGLDLEINSLKGNNLREVFCKGLMLFLLLEEEGQQQDLAEGVGSENGGELSEKFSPHDATTDAWIQTIEA